jgi:hypothetical protein
MDGGGSQLVLSFLSACPVRGTALHALCCAVLQYADAILVRLLVRERSSCAPRLPSTTLLTWYHHPAIARRRGQLQAPLLCWGRLPRSFRPAGLRQCRLEISCDTLLSGRLCLRWEMGGTVAMGDGRWAQPETPGRGSNHNSLTQGESPRARSPVPLLQSPSLAVPKPDPWEDGMPRTAGGREITICASKEWACPIHFFFLPFSSSLPRFFFFLGPSLPGRGPSC